MREFTRQDEAHWIAVQLAKPVPVSMPNAITLSGYLASLIWVFGGSWPFAIVGLLADELDGRGATSKFGGNFDWAVDMTMTGLCARRAGLAWMLPVVAPLQAWMRSQDIRPTLGSARAMFTGVALIGVGGR